MLSRKGCDPSNRHVFGVAVVLLLAGLYACWRGAALTWDGAYQLAQTLTSDQPYAYRTRLHSWLIWWPVVWLSRWTHDRTTLQVAFGLPFVLAPVVGLLVSWWLVRRDSPRLIVWAIFGTAIAPLPGQIFVINDSIFQQHLFWPVFLGLFVPLGRRQAIVLLGLALFQLSHPIGILLLALGVTTAAVLAWRDQDRRRRLALYGILLAGLTILAAAKVVCRPDPQAADEFHWLVAQNRWGKGVAGAPLAGLSLFWLAGVLVYLRTTPWLTQCPQISRWLGGLAFVAALGGGAVWLDWAGDERKWVYALDYRRWVVPLTLPFFALCILDCLSRQNGRANLPPGRAPDVAEPGGAAVTPFPSLAKAKLVPLCYVLAITFAAVLVVQSTFWDLLTRRLVADADAYPRVAVPRSAVPWVEGTPLQHWGLPTLLAVVEGPAPRKVLLYDPPADRRALRREPPLVPLAPWEWRTPEPAPNGWFDYRPVVGRLRAEEAGGE